MLPAEEAQDRAAQLTGIGAEAASVSDVLLTGQSAFATMHGSVSLT